MERNKKFFTLVALITLLVGGHFLFDRLNEGFTPAQIHSTLTPHPLFSSTFSPQEKEAFEQIFRQPFRYLGKGCQFYAFESSDRKYVLKFFKHKHLRQSRWLKLKVLPSSVREWADQKLVKKQKLIDGLLTSCQIAYQDLAQETGVLGVHLTKGYSLGKGVQIIDKAGFKHKIQLDDHEWVLQKRVEPAGAYLQHLAQTGQNERLTSAIQQLTTLVSQRCLKGIQDRDHAFIQNVAFDTASEQAIFVDIGQLYRDSSLKTAEASEAELQRRLGALKAWSLAKCPEILPFVEEEIRQLNN